MPRHEAPPLDPAGPSLPNNSFGEIKPFIALFVAFILAYGFWLLVFWPGLMGPDGLAILLQIKNPDTFTSGKSAFWFNYVRLLYGSHRLIELPIGLIMILSAFIMARILGWCWSQRLFKTTVFLLIFVCLAPHFIFFMSALYPDGIFAVAVAGLLFETWLVGQQRKAGFLSLLTIAVSLPFAVFARSNGIVFLIPVIILIFMVNNRADRIWISAIIVGWCALAQASATQDHHAHHEVLYPLALYETVDFLQPRPMKLWTAEPRISPRTMSSLTRNHPLELYLSHYDPDYWDPLNFDPTGPLAMALPQQDRNAIVREFFRYNLWHNFPKFMGSRVNIFLVAALAQGGSAGPGCSQDMINQVNSSSICNKFNLAGAERLLTSLYDHSLRYRWLLWTPALGMVLMGWIFCIGIRERRMVFLLVSIPMILQLVGIFIFSIAGEYRYLLHFFTLPVALLPLLAVHRKNPLHDEVSLAHDLTMT